MAPRKRGHLSLRAGGSGIGALRFSGARNFSPLEDSKAPEIASLSQKQAKIREANFSGKFRRNFPGEKCSSLEAFCLEGAKLGPKGQRPAPSLVSWSPPKEPETSQHPRLSFPFSQGCPERAAQSGMLTRNLAKMAKNPGFLAILAKNLI